MFVTRKRFDRLLRNQEEQFKLLHDRYWRLVHRHEMLLEHFGLYETNIPSKNELRKKGGPEHD